MATPSEPAPAPPAAPAPASPAPELDVERLVEKVYRLMLADVRLERARGAASPRPGERRDG